MKFLLIPSIICLFLANSCKFQSNNINAKPPETIVSNHDSTHSVSWAGLEPYIDSVCISGPKYSEPIRISINFPGKVVTKSFKILQLRNAITKTEEDSESGSYYYYFKQKIYDYDTAKKEFFQPNVDPLGYKLKDIFIFDINNDGIDDLIHYPGLYRAAMTDFDGFDIFLREIGGRYIKYNFSGFITEIKFGTSNEIKSFTTYEGPCCDSDTATFRSYSLNTSKDGFKLLNTIGLHLCQLIESGGDKNTTTNHQNSMLK